jgi:hypothetical protein
VEEAQVTIRYKYEVSGTASGGQTWTSSGEVTMEKEGAFWLVPDRAMREAFMQLTDGRAVYGLPGVGCKGPYTFLRLAIERV